MKKSPRSISKVRLVTAEADALSLRRAGFTFSEIGRKLGVTEKTARGYISRALDDLREEISEGVERIRALELDRLDELQRAFWPIAIGGKRVIEDLVEGGEVEVDLPPDGRAAELILRIMERREKLLGLEKAPVGTDVPAVFELVLGDSGNSRPPMTLPSAPALIDGPRNGGNGGRGADE